jgi:hypothetical protein
MSRKTNRTKRVIWTFVPTAENQSFLRKAMTRVVGRSATRDQKKGLKSRLINEALRLQWAHLSGKREAA